MNQGKKYFQNESINHDENSFNGTILIIGYVISRL